MIVIVKIKRNASNRSTSNGNSNKHCGSDGNYSHTCNNSRTNSILNSDCNCKNSSKSKDGNNTINHNTHV